MYKYANRWKLRFNASKCGVLVVGQKKNGKLWALGKEGIKEVDEYKYSGVWINRQVTGHNHVNLLEGKALGLQNLARGGKFWRDEEDIKAGLTRTTCLLLAVPFLKVLLDYRLVVVDGWMLVWLDALAGPKLRRAPFFFYHGYTEMRLA